MQGPVCVSNAAQAGTQPLTFDEFRRMVRVNKTCRDKELKGQAVTLFIGDTGAGKTTTALYLCGYKMARSTLTEHKELGVINRQVIECDNPPEGMKIGHRAQSETSVLKACYCADEEVLYCDAPGQDDTRGPLIDVVNSIAISSTARSCGNIRIVFVSSGRILEPSRGKAWVAFCALINRFINLEQHLDAVTILYTKIPKNASSIETLNNDLIELHSVHGSHPVVSAFIKHAKRLLDRHQEALIIDPFDSSARSAVANIIKASTSIPGGEDSCFGLPLTSEAQLDLINKCEALKQEGSNHLMRMDLPQLTKVLDDLHLLATETKLREVMDIYQGGRSETCAKVTEWVRLSRLNINSGSLELVGTYLEHLHQAERLVPHVEAELLAEKDKIVGELNHLVAQRTQIVRTEGFTSAMIHLQWLADVERCLRSFLVQDQRTPYTDVRRELVERIKRLEGDLAGHLVRLEDGSLGNCKSDDAGQASDSTSDQEIFVIDVQSETPLTFALAHDLELAQEVATLEAHLPHELHSLASHKIAQLRDMLSRCHAQYEKNVCAQVLSPADLGRQFRILDAVRKSRRLRPFLDQASQEQVGVVVTLLNKSTTAVVMGIQNLAANLQFDQMEPHFERLATLLGVDADFGREFMLGQLSDVLSALGQQLDQIAADVFEQLNRGLQAPLAQRHTIFGFVAQKLSSLYSARGLDSLLSTPLCQRAVFNAVQQIEGPIQLIREKLYSSLAEEEEEHEWPFVAHRGIQELLAFDPLAQRVPEIVEAVKELANRLEKHLESALSRLTQSQNKAAVAQLLRCVRQAAENAGCLAASPLLDQDVQTRLEKLRYRGLETFEAHRQRAIEQQGKFEEEGKNRLAGLQSQECVGEMQVLECVNAIKQVLSGLKGLKEFDQFVPLPSATIFDSVLSQVKALRDSTRIQMLEATQLRHMDIAEQKLVVLNAFAQLAEFVTWDDLADLSSTFKVKMLELNDEIPSMLKGKQFRGVAEILRQLSTGRTPVQQQSFRKTREAVYDHFVTLCTGVSTLSQASEANAELQAIDHVNNLLTLLESARILEEVPMEIRIGELLQKVRLVWTRMLDEWAGKFRWALSKHRYVVALVASRELEPYAHAQATCAELKAAWEEHLKKLPALFDSAVENANADAADAILNGIKDVEERYGYKYPQTSDLHMSVLERWRSALTAKLESCHECIRSHNVAGAEQALRALHRLKAAERMPPEAKLRIEDLQSQLDCMKQQNQRVGLDNPERLRSLLEDLHRADYRQFRKKLDDVNAEANERQKQFGALLPDLASRQVCSRLRLIINLFRVAAATFVDGPKELEEAASNLSREHEACVAGLKLVIETKWEQIQGLKKRRDWPQVNDALNQLEIPEKELAEYLPEEVRKGLAETRRDISQLLVELTSSRSTFEGINFTTKELSNEDLDNLNQSLAKLKRNSGLMDIESDTALRYEDAVSIIKQKLDELARNVESEWTNGEYSVAAVAVMNLNKIIHKVNDSTLKETAFNKKVSIIAYVAASMNALAHDASKHLQRDLDALEKCLLKLKKMESAVSRVAELLPESQHHKLVTELQLQVTSMATALKHNIASVLPSVDVIAEEILKLDALTQRISSTELHSHVHKEINGVLSALYEKKFDFFALGMKLRDHGTHGTELVEGGNYPQFKAFQTALQNQLTSRLSIEDAIKAMVANGSINAEEQNALLVVYQEFHKWFMEYQTAYLSRPVEHLDQLVTEMQSIANVHRGAKAISSDMKKKIPQLLGGIFAVWSVSTSHAMFKETKKLECVLKPHTVQMLAIFRLLELDTGEGWLSGVPIIGGLAPRRLANHLVQVGTGEGKSVVLAGLSTILSLYGFDVYCACYSKYLSKRDHDSFRDLFVRFGVRDLVTYSTLADLTGILMNEKVDIRVATNRWLNGKHYDPHMRKHGPRRQKILLIDEVDVFFDKEFYGSTYIPSTTIENSHVAELMRFVWQSRNKKALATKVWEQPSYLELLRQYSKFKDLIRNAVINMMADVEQFDMPPYVVTQDEKGANVIGYKYFGSAVTNMTFGYKTVFAYMREVENGTIARETMEPFLGLKVNCGQFSYAEVPKLFECILGVTGTLTTLGDFEQSVLKNDYKVGKQTVTPSIYGPSNLSFKEKDNVWVENDEVRYQQKILDEILQAKNSGRAVLVFFQDDQALRKFAASSYGKDLPFIDFSESYENIDFYVKKATRSGEISFLPRVYGRGMDFVCRDKEVEAAGGVHVIQTFLSPELSEEVQIRGRTARQGKKGSFALVLYADDIVKTFGLALSAIENEKKGNNLYAFLNAERNTWFNQRSIERKGIIDRSAQLHQETLAFCESFTSPFNKRTEEWNLQYLLKQNECRKPKARIICLSDATGSMTRVWANAKQHILEMIKRIEQIGGVGKAELMWVAYRDYCDGPALLESCSWTTDPKVLKQFIKKIKCFGGGDEPEAVEAALELASNTPGRTRVILIADAPPHLEGKGNRVEAHNRVLGTDYKEEAKKLKASGVPVYAFYMKPNQVLVNSFEEIASITGGRACLFENADTLTDVIAESVLHDLGGDALVQEYRKTYHS